jgi:DNA-binding protein YbaB
MDETILDPDGAMERMAAWKGRIDKLAADTLAMSERLQDLRVTMSDRNGLAEVTVDSTGALVGLRLTERIARVAPDVVAQAIMATIGEARSRMADQSQEVIAETVGTESAAARAIADRVGNHLRRNIPSEPTAPAASRPPVDDEDDGEYDIRSNLRR